jgi:aldehyde:ferredoxin oxidoreductase
MELYDKGIVQDKDTDGVPMLRGDANSIISAIHKIGKQEGFGKLFKNGVVEAAAKIGKGADYYAAAVKGMELEPYSYRVMKQYALAQATNTKGVIDAINVYVDLWIMADDRATKDVAEKNAEERYGSKEMGIPSSYKGAAVPTVDQEGRVAAGDMVGICKWLAPWFMTQDMDVPAKLFSLATGVQLSEADLLTAAQRVLTLERAINVIRGMRREDDSLPRRFFEEPEPVGPLGGERLLKEKFDEMVDDYYALRGYDNDGVPKEETFKKYGLSSEWEAFKKKAPGAEQGISEGADS